MASTLNASNSSHLFILDPLNSKVSSRPLKAISLPRQTDDGSVAFFDLTVPKLQAGDRKCFKASSYYLAFLASGARGQFSMTFYSLGLVESWTTTRAELYTTSDPIIWFDFLVDHLLLLGSSSGNLILYDLDKRTVEPSWTTRFTIPEYCIVTDYALGPTKHHGWAALSLFCLLSNGDVYLQCPVGLKVPLDLASSIPIDEGHLVDNLFILKTPITAQHPTMCLSTQGPLLVSPEPIPTPSNAQMLRVSMLQDELILLVGFADEGRVDVYWFLDSSLVSPSWTFKSKQVHPAKPSAGQRLFLIESLQFPSAPLLDMGTFCDQGQFLFWVLDSKHLYQSSVVDALGEEIRCQVTCLGPSHSMQNISVCKDPVMASLIIALGDRLVPMATLLPATPFSEKIQELYLGPPRTDATQAKTLGIEAFANKQHVSSLAIASDASALMASLAPMSKMPIPESLSGCSLPEGLSPEALVEAAHFLSDLHSKYILPLTSGYARLGRKAQALLEGTLKLQATIIKLDALVLGPRARGSCGLYRMVETAGITGSFHKLQRAMSKLQLECNKIDERMTNTKPHDLHTRISGIKRVIRRLKSDSIDDDGLEGSPRGDTLNSSCHQTPNGKGLGGASPTLCSSSGGSSSSP